MSFNLQASLKQLEASDPQATVWVNANAGSGKTHVLVDRVIRLMLGGTEPSRIMCLTFTKAAAAEMANRLFERLSHWIALDDEKLSELLSRLGSPNADAVLLERARQLFTRALETPGGLKIQTIHAFCERVLQLFPVEAGVVPHFTMLDDRQAQELLQHARNEVLREAKSDGTSPLGRALLEIANRVQPDAFDGLLSQLLSKRSSLRDVLEAGAGLTRAESLLRIHMSVGQGVTPQVIKAGLVADAGRYRDLVAALEGGTAKEKEKAGELRVTCARDGLTLLDLQDFLLTKEGDPRKGIGTKAVRARHPWLEDFVAAEQTRLTDGLGKLGDLECLEATLSVLRVGCAIMSSFEQAKRRSGCYDFDDLIIKTGELLREKPDAAWVLYKLDGGIEHLLVDEAQDTSPMQWQIVRALTEEFFAGEGRHGRKACTVFVVGDRKQSIYSFQGADPDVFESVRHEFQAEVEATGAQFRPVDFLVSFRSAPEILQAVDKVFARESIARSGLDGAAPRDWHHESNRRSASGLVEVWKLVEPVDPEEQDPWQAPVDKEPAHAPRRRLAKQLAQTIKGWIGKRMLASENRVVRPEDILILVRRRNAFFDAMIRALWNERVPVAGADRLKLGQNIAVLDLMALAHFCIMPEDDHALACVLKSPLLATPLDEDQLLAIAGERGTKSLWQSLRERRDAPYAAAAAFLGALILQAPSARPFEFFSGVLAGSRLRFIARLGSEANDAIDALLDQALSHEEENGTTLAGFVNWFAAGEIEIKRNMEQGSNEVRIMTVHGAKGLEAPIVILPDTTGFDAKADPLLMLEGGSDGFAKVPLWPVPKLFASRTVQALKDTQKAVQAAEYNRLLYVAMTRAKDELYICGYRGPRQPSDDCWYNTVCNALKPQMTEVEEGRWRLGNVSDMTAAEEAAAVLAAAELPSWISESARLQPALRTAEPPRPRRAEDRVARGILIHRILQNLPELPAAERATYIEQAIARAGAEPRLAHDIAALIGNPAFAELMAPEGLSEVPLIAELAGGLPQRRRIDRLVIRETDILVADYKTDRDVPPDIENCNPEYIAQMAAYRNALRKIHPGMPLKLCLVWTEAPLLMPVPDHLMDGHG